MKQESVPAFHSLVPTARYKQSKGRSQDDANALFGWLASFEGGILRLTVETGAVSGDVGDVAVTDNLGPLP